MFRQCEAIWLRPVGAVTFSNWKFLSVDSLSRHISVFRLINLSTLSLMLAWECRSERWCWWYFFGRDLLRYFVRSRVWLQSLPLIYITFLFFPMETRESTLAKRFSDHLTHIREANIYFFAHCAFYMNFDWLMRIPCRFIMFDEREICTRHFSPHHTAVSCCMKTFSLFALAGN